MIKRCHEVREFLIDYLERELPTVESLQFRLHLLFCRRCAEYLRRYHTSVELSRAVLDEPPPPELVDMTLRILDRRIRGEQPGNDSPGP